MALTIEYTLLIDPTRIIKIIMDQKSISIRSFSADDIPVIVDAFIQSKWVEKPASTFEQYLMEQQEKKREVWVAYSDEKCAGYITLTWNSQYENFRRNNIPEIVDLNVLPDFRKAGVGSMMMQKAEDAAASHVNIVGIGVGLYSDYGPAQRLYVKRGYIPDAKGITCEYISTVPGHDYRLDDDLILWFTKELK